METRLTVLRLINDFQVSQAIHTLVEMSIPDLLADGPQTSDDRPPLRCFSTYSVIEAILVP